MTETIEQEWLVDQCVCGHHISAHAKGKDACRYSDDCSAYRWDEVGIRRVPARPAEPTGELREQVARWLLEVFGVGLTWDQDATPELQEIFLRRAGQMLAGPLTPLLADHAAMQRAREVFRVWGTVAQPRDAHTKLYVLRRALADES